MMDEDELIIPDILRLDKARQMYAALCEEYRRVHGVTEIPDSSLALILDIATMEQIKQRLLEDIASRPVDHIRNGRQQYDKPNAAIGEVNKLISGQRRNLAELKLTPASKKGMTDMPADDEFSAF